MVLWRPIRPSKLTPKKRCPFHHRGLECKSSKSRDTGVTGKFGLGVQNEAGQRLTEFCEEGTWSQQTPSSNNTTEDSTQGHHQTVNTEIRLIIFFAVEDGEALYRQQKQDWELTVAQFMNSLLQNSVLNWRKQGKPLDHSGWPKSNPLWLYSGSDKQIQEIRYVDRAPEELRTEVSNTVQEVVIKTIPKKKKCKKAKWLSEEALQMAD